MQHGPHLSCAAASCFFFLTLSFLPFAQGHGGAARWAPRSTVLLPSFFPPPALLQEDAQAQHALNLCFAANCLLLEVRVGIAVIAGSLSLAIALLDACLTSGGRDGWACSGVGGGRRCWAACPRCHIGRCAGRHQLSSGGQVFECHFGTSGSGGGLREDGLNRSSEGGEATPLWRFRAPSCRLPGRLPGPNPPPFFCLPMLAALMYWSTWQFKKQNSYKHAVGREGMEPLGIAACWVILSTSGFIVVFEGIKVGGWRWGRFQGWWVVSGGGCGHQHHRWARTTNRYPLAPRAGMAWPSRPIVTFLSSFPSLFLPPSSSKLSAPSPQTYR